MGAKGSKTTKIKKDYDFKEKLGHGSFATVYKAIRKSDQKQFAVKIIQKTKLSKQELSVVHDEVMIMAKVEHINCVRLFETYETKARLYMIMELLTGGELFDSIVKKGNYSEKAAADVVNTIAVALKYLHEKGIVHRDLKPANLIYQNNKSKALLKITDFGLAKYRDIEKQDLLMTPCGTPGYVAPEVLKGEKYGAEVDIWSLGVILYILLCGFPPFYADTTTGLYTQIKEGRFEFPDPYWTEISTDAKEVVKGLLTVNPKKRWHIKKILGTPWVNGKASQRNFGAKYTTAMKLTIARRNLRIGIHSVIVINRFVRSLKNVVEKAHRAKDLKLSDTDLLMSIDVAKYKSKVIRAKKKRRQRCCHQCKRKFS